MEFPVFVNFQKNSLANVGSPGKIWEILETLENPGNPGKSWKSWKILEILENPGNPGKSWKPWEILEIPGRGGIIGGIYHITNICMCPEYDGSVKTFDGLEGV